MKTSTVWFLAIIALCVISNVLAKPEPISFDFSGKRRAGGSPPGARSMGFRRMSRNSAAVWSSGGQDLVDELADLLGEVIPYVIDAIFDPEEEPQE